LKTDYTVRHIKGYTFEGPLIVYNDDRFGGYFTKTTETCILFTEKYPIYFIFTDQNGKKHQKRVAFGRIFQVKGGFRCNFTFDIEETDEGLRASLSLLIRNNSFELSPMTSRNLIETAKSGRIIRYPVMAVLLFRV